MSDDLRAPQPNMNFLQDYKVWMKDKRRSPNTIQQYIYYLRIIPRNVEKYFSNSELGGKREKVAAYRSYLTFLCKKKRIIDRGELSYLLDMFEAPKRLGNNHSERKWAIPRQEWTKYIKKAPHHVAKMGMWLGFQFGLRRGEIVHLRINDISFENEEIVIRPHAKTKTTEAWAPKYGRTRFIPFVSKQARVLQRWITEERPKDLSHPYLLWTLKGKHRVLEKTFWHWMEKTGANPHILRYSFATNLYEMTKDVKLVCDLLGHSSVAITSDYLQLGHKQTMQKAREAFTDL